MPLFISMCSCRTILFTTNVPQRYLEEIKKLNAQVSYYFVLVDKNTILIERASLINGKTKDIKKEKDFLIDYLFKLKEVIENENF